MLCWFHHCCTAESSTILNLSHLKTELLTSPTLIFQRSSVSFLESLSLPQAQAIVKADHVVCALKYRKRPPLTTSTVPHGSKLPSPLTLANQGLHFPSPASFPPAPRHCWLSTKHPEWFNLTNTHLSPLLSKPSSISLTRPHRCGSLFPPDWLQKLLLKVGYSHTRAVFLTTPSAWKAGSLSGLLCLTPSSNLYSRSK